MTLTCHISESVYEQRLIVGRVAFFLTKAKGGAGLGLAIAKQMVEMHGGRIWVESTPMELPTRAELPKSSPRPARTSALSAATVVAQRCAVERDVFGLDFCETARDLVGRSGMIASVVRVLFLSLVLLTSVGTTASGQVDEYEEWSRRIGELRKAGRQADAIALAEEYREKAREGYGTEHPRYAIALKVLGNILQNTDRMEEAESLMRRALEIDEKSFGSEHPDVAEDLRHLGVILRNANRAGEAEALLRRSLAIEEKNFGPKDPRLIPALTELALFLSINEQTAEARQVFFRMLSIRQSVETATAAEHLCNSERQQKIDSAVKQRLEAHRKLDNCRKEYEKTKTFFTLETMDDRCKQQKTYADRADGKYRAASAKVCSPAARQ